MRRPFLAALLLLGTIGGYAAGIAHWNGNWHNMRDLRERHIADICVEAARRANAAPVGVAPAAPPAATPPAE